MTFVGQRIQPGYESLKTSENPDLKRDQLNFATMGILLPAPKAFDEIRSTGGA